MFADVLLLTNAALAGHFGHFEELLSMVINPTAADLLEKTKNTFSKMILKRIDKEKMIVYIMV